MITITLKRPFSDVKLSPHETLKIQYYQGVSGDVDSVNSNPFY